MAVHEFSLMLGKNVIMKFAVNEGLIKKGLSPEGKRSFKKLCDIQAHPCPGCGGGSIVKFFIENTYHENYDAYDDCVKGFVFMCNEIGVNLKSKNLFHSVQIEDLGKKFGFSSAALQRPEPESMAFRFVLDQAEFEMDFPKDEFRDTQESLRKVMDTLEHPCVHCAANYVLEQVVAILNSVDVRKHVELLAELFKAAYQIHIDLNKRFLGVNYPDDSLVIDLELLVERAFQSINK